MSDPRKPVHRPDAPSQEAVRQIVLSHLVTATTQGARDINATGASFVMIGLGIWISEMAETDARATSRLLHALGDLYDPASSTARLAHAEKRRRAAVDRLFSSLDLQMATPTGSA